MPAGASVGLACRRFECSSQNRTPPAQNPVLIKLWIGPEPAGSSGGGRRLLDAEHIVFKTDADGNPEQPQRQGPGLVFLRAERWAVHREGEAGAPKVLEYDICEWRTCS